MSIFLINYLLSNLAHYCKEFGGRGGRGGLERGVGGRYLGTIGEAATDLTAACTCARYDTIAHLSHHQKPADMETTCYLSLMVEKYKETLEQA